jgi:hypothetical protein
MLQEDEDFLHEIVIEMEPEDGVISVYGVGESIPRPSPPSGSKTSSNSSPCT